jgi:hypothetical protein
MEWYTCFAGVSPVAHANLTNPGGSLPKGPKATFKVVVQAKNIEDTGDRVWLSDGTGERSGINSYGGEFWGKVDIGDEVLLISEISPYNNQTELLYPQLIEVLSTGNAIHGPTVISGSDINSTIAADTDPAEKWEGVLVTVRNATANSFASNIYMASDDGGTTEFRVGDKFDLFDGPFSNLLMEIGKSYDITGFVVNRDGDYLLVPRDNSDIQLASSVNSNDYKSLVVYPNPATDYVTVSSTVEVLRADLYNASGRLVRQFNPASAEFQINFSDLAQGIYLIKVTTVDSEVQISRILK